MPRSYIKWTIEDDTWLEDHYSTSSNEELLARFPGRKISAIQTRASFIGVATSVSPYTQEEDDIILSMYNILGAKRLHKILPNHSVKSIAYRASVLGARSDYINHTRVSIIAERLLEEFTLLGI